MTGELFLYAAGRAAFESSPSSIIDAQHQPSPNKLILLGGLSDGLMPTPYTGILGAACQQVGWSLVQPVLSSSYTGFGHGSLERDTRELDELLQYLTAHRGCKVAGLVGHSTGCQQTVHYLQHGQEKLRKAIQVAVLQAPVSDREHAMTEPNYEHHMEIARTLVQQDKGQEMMPRSAFWAPISAQRFLDLQQRAGADDFFSSDFTNAELVERLGHVGANTPSVMVAWSGSDEYVPASIDGRILMDRLAGAMNSSSDATESAKGLYLAAGNHNLSQGPDDAATFVAEVGMLLRAATV